MANSPSVDRRDFLRASAAGSGALLTGLSGCIGQFTGGGGDAVGVGVLTMLDLDFGQSNLRGAELAAEDLNDADGILGRDVEVVSSNSEGTASGGVEAYNFLVDRENVDTTQGAFAESVAAGILPRIGETGRVHVNIGGVAAELAETVHDDYDRLKYWFRNVLNTIYFGIDVVNFAEQYMVGEQDWTRVAMFREDAAWTNGMAPVLKEQLPGVGVEVVDDIVFSLSENNFTPYYSDLDDMEIDAVLALIAEAGRAPFQGYAQYGLDTPMVGDLVFVQSPSFWDVVGEAGESVVGRTHSTWSAQLNDEAQTFVDRFEQSPGDAPPKPSFAAFAGYAAVQIFAEAAERAGTLDGDELVAAMEETDYTLGQRYQYYGPDEPDPVTGRNFTHDIKYGPDNYLPTWSQWRDGEQVTVFPPDKATGEYRTTG